MKSKDTNYIIKHYRIGCDKVLQVKVEQIDLAEIKALVEVTEQFILLTDKLLTQGEISQEEYDNMTLMKKGFLEDIRAKYF